MKKNIIFIFLIFCSAEANSQLYLNSFKYKINFKREKSESTFLISIKSGYHTGFEKVTYDGFNGGLIFSANIDGQVSEESFLSLSYEFWHNRDDNYLYKSGLNSYITTPRIYTGSNFSFNYLRRFGGTGYSINLGIGGGLYYIDTKLEELGVSTHMNLNMKLIGGFDIKFSDDVWISPEINYNQILRWEKPIGMFSFKIGPTIRLSN